MWDVNLNVIMISLKVNTFVLSSDWRISSLTRNGMCDRHAPVD